MKIERTPRTPVRLGDLEGGAVFTTTATPTDYYIRGKATPMGTVVITDLSTGVSGTEQADAPVIPINAKLVIEAQA